MRQLISSAVAILSLCIFAITSEIEAYSLCEFQLAPYLKHIGASTFAGAESFRGMSDGNWGDNNGLHFGVEWAAPIPYLSKFLAGFQLGGSCGIYDFAGQSYNSKHSRSNQGQEFISAGIFVRSYIDSPWSLGIVYDWMFNQTFGIYAESPIIQQLRGQVAYLLSSNDEIGVWGTYDTVTECKKHHVHGAGFQVKYRAIAQANIFWRRLYGSGIESTIWVGLPYRNRLNKENSHRPGKFIIGGELSVPFFERWALVGRASFMQAGTKRGSLGAREYVSNIVCNLVYHFGGNPMLQECSSVWMPYMSIGNNSNFFVDSAVRSSNLKWF